MNTKPKKEDFKILNIERGNNSYYGNPSYYLTVENENGEILRGKTASNASVAYAICYSMEGKVRTFTYHYTKNGNMIFDYMD